jgi:Rrf2 family protein
VRISSRGRYGLRAMIYLAGHEGAHPVPLSEIAASEGISPAFLERIAAQLRSAGLVSATRGAAGGYRLTRQAAEISVADVVVALEGPLDLLDCVHDAGVCGRRDACPSRRALTRLDEAVEAALAGVTLNDLVTEGMSQ